MSTDEAVRHRQAALEHARREARVALERIEQAGSERGGTAASTAISYLDAGQYDHARTFTITAGGIEKDAGSGMESEAGFAHRALDRCCQLEVQLVVIAAGLEPDPVPCAPGERFGVRGGTSVFDASNGARVALCPDQATADAVACTLTEHADTFDRWRGRPRIEDVTPIRAAPLAAVRDLDPSAVAVRGAVSNAGPVVA